MHPPTISPIIYIGSSSSIVGDGTAEALAELVIVVAFVVVVLAVVVALVVIAAAVAPVDLISTTTPELFDDETDELSKGGLIISDSSHEETGGFSQISSRS